MAYCPRQPGPASGQTPRPAGWLAAGLLAVALLLGQTLGLVHTVVHGGAPAVVAGQPLEHLFDDHDDASGCRLFDQASHADLAPALALVLPVLQLFAVWIPCSLGPVLPRQGAPFEARGPPARH